MDTASFDAFLVYGLGLNSLQIESHRFFSQSLLDQAVRDHVEVTTSFHVLSLLREVSERPIFVGGNPLRADSSKTKGETDSSDLKYGDTILKRFLWEVFAACWVTQPAETVVQGATTAKRFTRGSQKLAVGLRNDNRLHDPDDVAHMNADFGKIWMKSFLENDLKTI